MISRWCASAVAHLSRIFKGRVADADATVVARLKAAGGILIAKTDTPASRR
jgi:Asp-tRNA(Asn)/Glu-tRNA(Gln) amidotransferase A subunit family amidase